MLAHLWVLGLIPAALSYPLRAVSHCWRRALCPIENYEIEKYEIEAATVVLHAILIWGGLRERCSQTIQQSIKFNITLVPIEDKQVSKISFMTENQFTASLSYLLSLNSLSLWKLQDIQHWAQINFPFTATSVLTDCYLFMTQLHIWRDFLMYFYVSQQRTFEMTHDNSQIYILCHKGAAFPSFRSK